MYYIIQDRLFKEFEWDILINSLERLELEYEIVQVFPMVDTIEFKTSRKDVFCFGALKLARIGKQYNWNPGCIITPNHDFNVYKNHYKENLLNWDSKIYKFTDDWDWKGRDYFIRPTEDTKVFTGEPFTEEKWLKKREYLLTNGHKTVLTVDTPIQVASIKRIQKEFRFYIINDEIVTASLYRMGCFINYSDVIDDGAMELCERMVKLYRLADAYTIDICLTDGEWKIIECGSLNCAGLYKANIPKILMAVEDYFNPLVT